jgi:hypothetical protein
MGKTQKRVPFFADMHHISDTVMTLAALAPLAEGPTTIRNVANIRIKETDRMVAIVNELKRLGAETPAGRCLSFCSAAFLVRVGFKKCAIVCQDRLKETVLKKRPGVSAGQGIEHGEDWITITPAPVGCIT